MSITTRIAFLSTALALVTSIVLLAFVSRQTHAEAVAAVRRETIGQADTLVAAYRSGGLIALRGAIADADAANDQSLAVLLLGSDGLRLGGFGPARLTVTPLTFTGFQIGRIGRDSGWETREAGYTIRRVGEEWLLTARTLDLIVEEDRALERALLLSMLLAPVLGVAAGLIVARYVGGRLDQVAAVIEHAGQGDLTRRVVPGAGGGDAFDRLAGCLNAMLEKLERVMGELRVVTDGLAHDLRSPLARLRTKTELALLTYDPAQREVALTGLLGETDLVLRMLSTLIEISRSEAATRDRFIRVDPAALVEEVGELYAPVAEDAGLLFRIVIDERPAPLALHRELVSQAITNLLDNAIHHGGTGGAIVLRVACAEAGAVAIQVEDRGPGIATADRAQARRRFGRLDAARSTPGAGLGLALIEAVVRLHGGRFELGDNQPGLVARIVLVE
ncbi:sensor histidine kinase [Sphingomonas bacterium]|uniref:sensor histidine kinase n=1 Tax=Sphingomonas bacterium TaxID=1895847 RepID=UPI0020C623C1|nr:HAMP domain-containing sensor histidine kinase [Sphingomonas bacterium]